MQNFYDFTFGLQPCINLLCLFTSHFAGLLSLYYKRQLSGTFWCSGALSCFQANPLTAHELGNTFQISGTLETQKYRLPIKIILFGKLLP